MKQYVVDAFTDKVFAGNPAAVCIMNEWISDELMMNITRENNLSETAFAVKEGNIYRLRWSTPGGEIDLCGHATLGAAYVLFRFYEKDAKFITFSTRSGALTVAKKDDLYEMEFPKYTLHEVDVTDAMEEALGVRPAAAYMGRDLLCVYDDGAVIEAMTPDFAKVKTLDGLLVHVTARGKVADTVSRSFAPKLSVQEDPVCGSGHCHIVPYWAERLGKDEIVAYQASRRGGTIYCRVASEKIFMAGKAALYSEAEIYID